MLEQHDLKWIATTSTELTSILQQISRYCDLSQRHKDQAHYLKLMAERVELATKTAQALFDKVTANILANAVNTVKLASPQPTPFTVLPPPLPFVPGATPVSVTSKTTKPVKTTPKNAATATVEFPPEVPIRNAKGNRELILLVEDEAEVADLAAEMLADEGYKVTVAHNGFDALKIYGEMGDQIGLVILDYFLPVMDGDAVFDELRVINPDVNVVLSSGFAEEHKISAMLGQGLRGFIPKPYSREKLLRQVRSTLDAARQAVG